MSPLDLWRKRKYEGMKIENYHDLRKGTFFTQISCENIAGLSLTDPFYTTAKLTKNDKF